MKIAVVGSRKFGDRSFVEEKLRSRIYDLSKYNDLLIISGGASGVDTWAADLAKSMNIPTLIFKAEWDKYGKKAGALRNQKIVDEADAIIVFWDGVSKGTEITMKMARIAKKPIEYYVRQE